MTPHWLIRSGFPSESDGSAQQTALHVINPRAARTKALDHSERPKPPPYPGQWTHDVNSREGGAVITPTPRADFCGEPVRVTIE